MGRNVLARAESGVRDDSPTPRDISTAALNLHELLRLADASAREELARLLLPAIRSKLRRLFLRADAADLNDAVEDAILEYLACPQRFDPLRGVSLDTFLFVVARRRLANRFRQVATRRRLEHSYAAEAARRSRLICPSIEADAPQPDELRSQLLANISDIRERTALCSWLEGASASRLIEALGLSGLSQVEQPRELKRFKDRIRKRLRKCLLSRREIDRR